jgi:protein-S-isoprenylcysteine O-methyltransferase Ste14
VVPGALFLVLATVQLEILVPELKAAYHHLSDMGVISLAVNRLLFLLFVAGVAVIYVIRKPAALGRREPTTFAVSMYASFVLLALRPVSDLLQVRAISDSNTSTLVVSDVLLICGVALAAYSLAYLRFNFSILPEARALVTTGPYRLVRHPIYLGEIIGAFGLVLAVFSWLSVAVLVSFVAAQLYRTRIEEGVLAKAIPEYAAYRRATPHRLIPGVV